MSRVLLDTDIYSEVIKAINPMVTQNAIAYRQANGVLMLSVVTVMEIVRGFQQNQSIRRLNNFLTAVASEEVLIFDQPAAELAGRYDNRSEVGARIIGMTPCGRVTVIALQLNNWIAVMVRREWIAAGWHPPVGA